ncbi:hypothetical protein BDW22DRAFT_1351123 [Trametopsis cervina]|nr:hypothetical protein BDW22DRAFT_1351123 [Trametopsis cervina]
MAAPHDSSAPTSPVRADPSMDTHRIYFGRSRSQSILPQEILDYILDFVDREALCLCRLSSRTLLRRATQLIFRHIYVNKRRAAEMVEEFTQHSYKASAVFQLTFYSSPISRIEAVHLDQYTAIMSCLPNVQRFSIQDQVWKTPEARVVPFQGFSAANNVTEVSFTSVLFRSPVHFLSLVNAFPKLRELSMNGVFWETESFQSYDAMHPPFRPPPLHALNARLTPVNLTTRLLIGDTVHKLESAALEATTDMHSWWPIFENGVVYDNMRKMTISNFTSHRADGLPKLPKVPNLQTLALTGMLIRNRNARQLDHARYIMKTLENIDSDSVEELFLQFIRVGAKDIPLFSPDVWMPCLKQSKFARLKRVVYTFVDESLTSVKGEITTRVMEAHASLDKRILIEIIV